MSHIHIPDGFLPLTWWVVGLLLTGLICIVAIRKLEKTDVRKKIPYLGVVCALMLVTMSVPLGPLPFHINLTVLTGILAGPWLGFLAVFIVNIFLSFIGHGGITVVGVNTLILGLEVFLGWGVFQFLRVRAKEIPAACIATILALLVSTTMVVGIVGLSKNGWEYALPHSHNKVEEHQSEVITVPQNSVHEHEAEQVIFPTKEHNFKELLAEVSFLHVSGFFALIIILTTGIFLEVCVTIFLIRFFKIVRPDLIS